jgi:hypothetical protein
MSHSGCMILHKPISERKGSPNMQTVNDVMVFEHGEAFTLPEEFPPLPEYGTDFGFKIKENNGTKEWVPMEESDFRRLQAQVGLSETQTNALVEKILAGGPGCFIRNGVCDGYGCPPHSACKGYYYPNGQLYACHCAAV